MARLALAFAAGALASLHVGALPSAPLLALLLVPPIGAWRRPVPRALVAAAAAGLVAGHAAARDADCPAPPAGPVVLVGRFVAPAGAGTTDFVVEGAGRCARERVWTDAYAPAGWTVRLDGVRRTGWGRGVVLARSVELLEPRDGGGGGLPWAGVRWRGALVERIHALYGDRGPLVAALVLARREGLDPGLRDGFARAGTAHLLAISGFHVGVVAGLFLVVLRSAGVSRRRAEVSAAAATWAYVVLLGVPAAAARAALIITAAALARARGRPPARWGGVSTAFLLLVATGPERLTEVGFQLSFAGSAGLLAWAGPLSAVLRRGPGRRLPRAFTGAVGAGAAATLATLPVVAWHFERVSIVGIPATLVSSPLVAVALPGALATLVLDPWLPGPAAFLAGGVDTLLVGLAAATSAVADLPWASAWVPRTWVVVACAGAWPTARLLRRPGTTAAGRRWSAALVGAACVVGWPLAAGAWGSGAVELVAIDVGQGDATAIRTPRGRWLLVDAGPPAAPGRQGAAVQALRRRGVVRLEALVLTHPDLDHVGGADEVLARLDVGVVVDPGRATGKDAFVGVLEAAAARGVPWRAAVAGQRWEVDGVEVRVLHPRPSAGEGEEASNDLSVVLLVRFGAFEALLTGDAPASVERQLVARGAVPPLEVLKVGHHGSDTSTDSLLLARAAPRVGLVSAGRGNRYGHPTPDVLARLSRAGVIVHRTDRSGTLRVTARRDGSFEVRAEGGGVR